MELILIHENFIPKMVYIKLFYHEILEPYDIMYTRRHTIYFVAHCKVKPNITETTQVHTW